MPRLSLRPFPDKPTVAISGIHYRILRIDQDQQDCCRPGIIPHGLITHIRIIPSLQSTLRHSSLLLLPQPRLRLDRILPLCLIFPQYQSAPSLLLPFCTTCFCIRDRKLCSMQMILKILFEMDYLLASLSRGSDRRSKKGRIST